ncbi:unnamed protein product [Adineta ricciae]|uniref:G-protein coupled receptors family 1 profile domain-containing protein n=1 Tax=Adineta ricciae TaxID=249248 RepID=A0A814U322_ADIRI|nr:unnamed protein product [Adineta ricciae]CAF1169723.1 unnamed protein product [Adineta ricciae]
MVNIELWFIPIDIISIIGTSITILLGIIFLLLIIFNKTSRTIPMILIANTSLSAIAWGSSMLSIAIFTLQNDLQRIETYDIFCIIRPFFGYGLCGTFHFSLTLQSLYRYMIVVHPKRLFYQSIRFQLFLMILTWISGFVIPIESIARNELVYNIENQICQIPLRFSFSIIYMANCIYLIPIAITIFIYYKLVRYVKSINTHTTSINVIIRARRQLKMVTRIITIILILLFLGIPYLSFILMSFFTIPFKYHFRIAFVFVDVSMAAVMIVLFQFTEQFQSFLIAKRKAHHNIVAVLPVVLN